MSAASTVPTVKARLVAVLDARAGLDGVQVTNGHPGGLLEREAIYVARARGRHEIASIRAGRKTRDETYALEMFVYVLTPGAQTLTAAEERAFAILAEIEDALADDPRLGIPETLDYAGAGDFETDTGWVEDGAESVIRLQVECRARLS